MKHMLAITLFCASFSYAQPTLNPAINEAQQTISALIQSIEDELKKPEYIKTILPNNFSYVTQLLKHGTNLPQPRTYIKSVVKIFNNMVKGCQYVNAYAFSTLLQQLPSILKPVFDSKSCQTILASPNIYDLDRFSRIQDTMNTALFNRFNTRYDEFKKDPQHFLTKLNEQLFEINEEELNIELLRQTVIRFLETCLSKLIWSSLDDIQTWNMTKQIGTQLGELLTNHILDDVNDLDDLYWSLVHRYSYFLDLAGTDMGVTFYEKLRHDIATSKPIILELEEQESFIESKYRHLMRTAMNNEAECRSLLMEARVIS